MATFRVQPSRHAAPARDDLQRVNALFGGRIIFPWDQVAAVQGALVGMAERAPQGLANGTNRAADQLRSELVHAIEAETTLAHAAVDDQVRVYARATADHPAAGVRIENDPQPMSGFDCWEGDGGIFAMVRRSEGARFLAASFFGEAPLEEGAVYQRGIEGNHRAGRLPIQEKAGPSVAAIAAETPGLMDEQLAGAQALLVTAIDAERDRIVTEFLAEGAYQVALSGEVLHSFVAAGGASVSLTSALLSLPLRFAKGVGEFFGPPIIKY
jgi:hypothetical protein